MSTPKPSSNNTNNHQPSLSFPRATFAKLSPRPFLLAHLQPSSPSTTILRPNGRHLDEFRAPAVHTGSLTHANGSAVVRIGDTTVVCGVRGEILLASDVPGYDGRESMVNRLTAARLPENLRIGLLVPNVELATGCSPANLPGQPPSPLAQSLAARILSLLECSALVEDEDLRIRYRPEDESAEPVVKAFWTLYIDVLFISLDGNPFDAAWAAIWSALSDVRLPYAYWDVDRERVLCEDVLSKARRLSLRGAPMPSTFSVFTTSPVGEPVAKTQQRGSWVLADPDAFEEGLCDEKITVTVDCSRGTKPVIIKIEKSGGSVTGREEVKDLASVAMVRWMEWQKVLRQAAPTK